jgi:hypothetical protein
MFPKGASRVEKRLGGGEEENEGEFGQRLGE